MSQETAPPVPPAPAPGGTRASGWRTGGRPGRRPSPAPWLLAGALTAALASHDGDPVLHLVLGGLFTAGAVGHLVVHRRWVRGVARRIPRGVQRRVAVDALVDALLFLLAGGVAVTGLIALATGSDAAAHQHGHLSVVLVVLVGWHVVRHRGRRRRRRRRATS